MRDWRAWAAVGVGCLLLAGCAERNAAVSPAQAVSMLQTGRPLLSCREACRAEWQSQQPQAAQLAAAARWQELAVLVLRVGYQDDLSLYYLGRAAEGLGYVGAAASYYRQSMQLSGTSISCLYLTHLCGGEVLPQAAALRLAAIDRQLNRQYRRGPRRRPASAPGEAPAPGAAQPAVPVPAEPAPPAPTGPAVQTPAPAPAPAQANAPSAAPATASPPPLPPPPFAPPPPPPAPPPLFAPPPPPAAPPPPPPTPLPAPAGGGGRGTDYIEPPPRAR